MSDKKYKLTYFNARGVAEISRLIFAAGGVKYEDVRIERAQWPAMKPTTPMGHLPTLQIDDFTLCESGAINRYLAREFGLSGGDSLEQAKVDMVASAYMDLTTNIGAFMRESDETKKAELKKKFFAETLPDFFGKMDKMFQSNNGGKGFFVGDKLTYADIVSYHICSQLTRPVMDPTALDAYPTLKSHCDRIGEIQSIKTWVETRPVTDM